MLLLLFAFHLISLFPICIYRFGCPHQSAGLSNSVKLQVIIHHFFLLLWSSVFTLNNCCQTAIITLIIIINNYNNIIIIIIIIPTILSSISLPFHSSFNFITFIREPTNKLRSIKAQQKEKLDKKKVTQDVDAVDAADCFNCRCIMQSHSIIISVQLHMCVLYNRKNIHIHIDANSYFFYIPFSIWTTTIK